MHYDLRLRPAQPATPAPDAFDDPSAGGATKRRPRRTVDRVRAREPKRRGPAIRCFYCTATPRRNESGGATSPRWPTPGYEVIAPDLRGYGDSDLSPADVYDIAAWSRDLYLLVHDVLGHDRCGVVGGDLGGVVAVDLLHRYPGFVEKLVLLRQRAAVRASTTSSLQASTSLRSAPSATGRQATTATCQGATPDELAAELDTPAKRRRVHRRDVRAPAVGVAGHVHRG